MPDSVCSADHHQATPRYHRPHHHHHHQSHHHDHDGHHNTNPALRGDERGPAAQERSGPHRQHRPRPQPRRRSPSPSRSRSRSPAAASSSCCSSSGYRNGKALVPRARSARRGSALSDAGESGPEEYTVYPDGRIHEHRRRRRRRGDWDRKRNRGGVQGGYGYDDDDDGGYEKGRRRPRSRDEAKGFLLAALVFVAGVILCWD